MSWVARDGKRRKPRPGRLRRHHWDRFLRGPDPELLEKLYIPALAAGVRYDRCCSYFSSSVLAAAARGFAKLTERLLALADDAPKPAVRLLVNEELPANDVTTLLESGNVAALEATLVKRFKTPREALEKSRLQMLAWLYKSGYLDIMVGVMRQGEGIVHPKFGIVTDAQGDAIVFRGSGNESALGVAANLENFEVSTSWRDPAAHDYYRSWFEQLWTNNDPYVHTVPLPEAVRQKLIKLAPPEPPLLEPTSDIARQRAAMLWRYIAAAPYLANGAAVCDATMLVDLWPHQIRVIDDASTAWPAGRLLCDEVGMGKTLEAIGVIRRLRTGRGVGRTLLLVPAGLMRQWQDELREKGGMVVPRYDGNGLVWPDDRQEKADFKRALEEDTLILSREYARLDKQLPVLLAAPSWDLVVMDEAHAARRAEAKEGEFNSPNLLLGLLRKLQLCGKTRGILLLSATPMQIHPWEPWDLLTTLGVGGLWCSEFRWVRTFYGCLGLLATRDGLIRTQTVRAVEALLDDLPDITARPDINKLPFAVTESQRNELAEQLRRCSPLSQRMHRNSRETLRAYHRLGLLDKEPPRRFVNDLSFEYQSAAEARLYRAVGDYIDARFGRLEREKPGKGFVMTIYRRRASSSPHALHESLRRRREGLERVRRRLAVDEFVPLDEDIDQIDVEEFGDWEYGRVPMGYPDSVQEAENELAEIDRLLKALDELGPVDTKRDVFCRVVDELLGEGRRLLVFSSYTDTVNYVRDCLKDIYGDRVGSYTGRGGHFWDGQQWVSCSKEDVAARLRDGTLQILVCNDAASEGLNLQAASAVVNYDLPWNPSRVEQRIGRVDRIGQEQDVVKVVNLLLRDSVDERVYSLLRQRCGLFVHFVGPMQRVLAAARDVLLGRISLDASGIEKAAEEVNADTLIQESYRAEEAVAVQTKAPVSRADISYAISVLTKNLPVVAYPEGSSYRLEFRKPGQRVRASLDPVALGKDTSLLPLVPDSELAHNIAGTLAKESELLPLVIGTRTAEKNQYRRSVAFWLGNDDDVEIENFRQLRTLVERWDGSRPTPQRYKQAEQKANKLANAAITAAVEQANRIEKAGREAQVAAARLRLLQELGRFLASLAGNTADLNKTFYKYMSGRDPTALRLRRAFELLGNQYPEWPEVIKEDLAEFCRTLSEDRRTALRAGSELDAAMADPRWAAASHK